MHDIDIIKLRLRRISIAGRAVYYFRKIYLKILKNGEKEPFTERLQRGENGDGDI